MKLYTEEQVIKALELSKTVVWGEKGLGYVHSDSEILDMLTPIELPSDEEIEKTMIDQDVVRQQGYCHCFLEGAKWMKEQILNQNK